jgi:hypothetical protein
MSTAFPDDLGATLNTLTTCIQGLYDDLERRGTSHHLHTYISMVVNNVTRRETTGQVEGSGSVANEEDLKVRVTLRAHLVVSQCPGLTTDQHVPFS